MKTLYLVRHGKSAWSDPNTPDVERPLLEKGRKRTERMAEYIINNDLKPDLIITSHAVRAYTTATILAQALEVRDDCFKIDKSIYHGNAETIRQLFYNLPQNTDSLMIVGHNPTMTDFANDFPDVKIEWLQTSAVVALKFNTDNWLNVLNTKPEILFYIYPSLLKEK